MTEMEYKAVKALANCRFLPGTFEKRIARQWAEKAAKDLLAPMTDKGRACLWRLVWKYRKQIDDDIVNYAMLQTEIPAAQTELAKQIAKNDRKVGQLSLMSSCEGLEGRP